MQARDTELAEALASRGFRVSRELGRGAAGRVLLATDLRANREVALKIILTPEAAGAVQRFQRFLREAEVVAGLNHPGIVSVHDAFAVAGYPCIVYEFVPGGRTLEQAFATEELGGRLELVRQVAEALGYVHEQGLIHRDVKPGNVLISEDGRARLTDFGLVGGEGLDRLTKTGALLGTPYYMAPEQSVGKGAGPRSDVWSLGVLLYEALTGVLPFEASSQLELLAKVAGSAATPPSAIAGSLPKGAQEVCLRALSKESEDRQADAGAFADDLAAVQAGTYAAPAARGRTLAVVLVPLVVLIGLAVAGAFVATEPEGEVQEPEPPPSRPEAGPSRPSSAAGWRARGLELVRAEDRVRAVEAFSRALELDPADFEARRARAEALLNLKEPQRALDDLDACLALRATDAEVYYQRALVVRQLGRGWPEELDLDRVVKTPLGSYFRARVRCEKGRVDEALADFEVALAQLPEDWRVHFGRGLARKACGDVEGAISDLEAAAARSEVPELHVTLANFLLDVSRSDEALRLAEGVLERDPDSEIALVVRAKIKLALEDLPGARRDLERALELKSDSLEALFALARLLEVEGKEDEALATYERVVAKPGASFGALNNLSNFYLRKGRFEDAEGLLRRALTLQPTSAEITLNLANVCRKLKRPGESLEFARRALELGSDPHFLETVAHVLIKLGESRDALAALDRVRVASAESAKTHYFRGLAQRQLGQQEEALRSLTAAIEQDGSEAHHWKERGFLLVSLGRHGAAERDFDRSIELSENPKVIAGRGVARYQQGKHKAALKDWSHALRLDPEQRTARENRLVVLVGAQRWREAIPDLEHLLARKPKDPNRRLLLGQARLSTKDARGCLRELKRYRGLKQASAESLALEGRAYAALGNHERALSSFVEGERLEPTHFASLVGKSLALHALGRYREEIEVLDRLIRLVPAGKTAPLKAQRARAQAKL